MDPSDRLHRLKRNGPASLHFSQPICFAAGRPSAGADSSLPPHTRFGAAFDRLTGMTVRGSRSLLQLSSLKAQREEFAQADHPCAGIL